ncbi:hypothetical protein TRVL_06494 [Trypanosoma vivax]|nr:hypothetical protein TRVL_06494 [Trypanosoma vivax]
MHSFCLCKVTSKRCPHLNYKNCFERAATARGTLWEGELQQGAEALQQEQEEKREALATWEAVANELHYAWKYEAPKKGTPSASQGPQNTNNEQANIEETDTKTETEELTKGTTTSDRKHSVGPKEWQYTKENADTQQDGGTALVKWSAAGWVVWAA